MAWLSSLMLTLAVLCSATYVVLPVIYESPPVGGSNGQETHATCMIQSQDTLHPLLPDWFWTANFPSASQDYISLRRT